jgi:hypothetical protein
MIDEYHIEVIDLKTLEVIDQLVLDEPIDLFYLSPKRENLMIVCILNEVILFLIIKINFSNNFSYHDII